MKDQQGQSQKNQKKWWGSPVTWLKKQYFNSAHLIDITLQTIDPSPQIHIFGNMYSNADAQLIYSSLLWFTYRENLKIQGKGGSDVGWGCMLRVGQMMLAQALRMEKGVQQFGDEQRIHSIIKNCIESNGRYSLQKFVEVGKRMFGKKVGQWFSPSETAYIIRQLQNRTSSSISPTKVIVLDNQFQINSCLRYLSCKNTDKFAKIQSLSKSKKQSQLPKLPSNIQIDPGLIIILVRIGYNSPQKQLLDSVINILKTQQCSVGILGGQPSRAYYLVGCSPTSFIYLDPHCVKSSTDISSFFCDRMFSIEHNKIDPSMALCFFVRDTVELMALHDRMEAGGKGLPFYSYTEGNKQKLIQIAASNANSSAYDDQQDQFEEL